MRTVKCNRNIKIRKHWFARTPICAPWHSLHDFGPKQMRSSFCDTQLIVCIVRQCVFQSFVIPDTAVHKNSTNRQLIFKKLKPEAPYRGHDHYQASYFRDISCTPTGVTADEYLGWFYHLVLITELLDLQINPLKPRQRTTCNYWRLTYSLIFLISSVKSPSWHDEKKRE